MRLAQPRVNRYAYRNTVSVRRVDPAKMPPPATVETIFGPIKNKVAHTSRVV